MTNVRHEIVGETETMLSIQKIEYIFWLCKGGYMLKIKVSALAKLRCQVIFVCMAILQTLVMYDEDD